MAVHCKFAPADWFGQKDGLRADCASRAQCKHSSSEGNFCKMRANQLARWPTCSDTTTLVSVRGLRRGKRFWARHGACKRARRVAPIFAPTSGARRPQFAARAGEVMSQSFELRLARASGGGGGQSVGQPDSQKARQPFRRPGECCAAPIKGEASLEGEIQFRAARVCAAGGRRPELDWIDLRSIRPPPPPQEKRRNWIWESAKGASLSARIAPK